MDALRPYLWAANRFTGLLVSDSQRIPEGYISSDGNDIGPNVEDGKWREYLASQSILKIFCLWLLLWFLVMVISG